MIVKRNDSVMVLHTDVKILLNIEHSCVFRDQNATFFLVLLLKRMETWVLPSKNL